MKKEDRKISDAELAEEIIQASPVADRARLVGLDYAALLSAAKTRSSYRETLRKAVKYGEASAQVKEEQNRLKTHQALQTEIQVNTQLAEIEVPEQAQECFVLHGRVVDRSRLGIPELTVALVNAAKRSWRYTCTDRRGYFRFELCLEAEKRGTPAESQMAVSPEHAQVRMEQEFSLQVSNQDKAVLYRGTEVHKIEPGRVVFREIVLSEDGATKPCAPPPEPGKSR